MRQRLAEHRPGRLRLRNLGEGLRIYRPGKVRWAHGVREHSDEDVGSAGALRQGGLGCRSIPTRASIFEPFRVPETNRSGSYLLYGLGGPQCSEESRGHPTKRSAWGWVWGAGAPRPRFRVCGGTPTKASISEPFRVSGPIIQRLRSKGLCIRNLFESDCIRISFEHD